MCHIAHRLTGRRPAVLRKGDLRALALQSTNACRARSRIRVINDRPPGPEGLPGKDPQGSGVLGGKGGRGRGIGIGGRQGGPLEKASPHPMNLSMVMWLGRVHSMKWMTCHRCAVRVRCCSGTLNTRTLRQRLEARMNKNDGSSTFLLTQFFWADCWFLSSSLEPHQVRVLTTTSRSAAHIVQSSQSSSNLLIGNGTKARLHGMPTPTPTPSRDGSRKGSKAK